MPGMVTISIIFVVGMSKIENFSFQDLVSEIL